MQGNGKIDWAEIHQRLDGVSASLAKGFSPDAEEKAKILKARAEQLSRKSEEAKAGETLEVVEFLLAQEQYGIETRYVREVYPLKDYTPVPCTPPFVLGLINVRGQAVSVIDLKKFFDMPEKGLTDLNKVIIIHDDKTRMEFGILADSILGVRRIAASDIQDSLPALIETREDYLKGVTEEQLVLLDGKKILSSKAIVIHEEV